MAPRPTPRVVERAGFAAPVRLRLVESDMDEFDLALEQITKRLDKILAATVGVLVSVTTSAVLLALNLVVR